MQTYIGLDIHKKFAFAVVINSKGIAKEERKIKNDPHDLEKFFKKYDKDSNIVLESCSCWEHYYDYITDMGFTNVVLANPSKVGLIARSRKKTDAHDARILADLLRSNMLPTSYAPPNVIRNQRKLTRYRAAIGQRKSRLKSAIHAILIRNGIEHNFTDLFGVAGIEYLRSIDLPMIERFQLDQCLELIRHHDVHITKTQSMIEDFVQYLPEVKLLMTIPGISYYSGLSIFGEIGEIQRFHSSKKLTAFAGLNPSVSQSGDKCYTGRIAKQGNKHLRWMLGQCANIAIMHDPTLSKIYYRLRKRKNHNVAITTIARKMLCFIYIMLKHNLEYNALQVHKQKAS